MVAALSAGSRELHGPTEHEGHLPHATVSDIAHVQRATVACMVPLRSLGQGAFAAVELVSVPVAGKRKLVVCKKLVPHEQQPQNISDTTQEQQKHEQPQPQLPVVPALKPSSQQDWTREVGMHREAAGCPFVLQLLAAKKCRAGNMLLLTEYAAAGSLTDVLARMRLQQHRARRAQQEQAIRRCQSAAALLQRQVGPQDPDAVTDASDDAVLLAANSDGAATLSDVLSNGHTPTAMLIHGVDIDIAQDFAAAVASNGVDHCSMHHEPVGLCEESARFYTACILMGLQWLHSRRILHRDIKPCNLLLFSDGYLKLADLGCCCLLPPGIDSCRSRTGTASYMAPEVVDHSTRENSGYSFPVDMWSLGVTLWQMVAGSLPDWAEQQQQHHHQHHQQHHQQQAAGQQVNSHHHHHHTEGDVILPLEPATGCHTTPKDLEFPAQFSQELCELLTGLLDTDSEARLSIPQVQAAAWFKGFDWQALQAKTLPPPALPSHAMAPVQQG